MQALLLHPQKESIFILIRELADKPKANPTFLYRQRHPEKVLKGHEEQKCLQKIRWKEQAINSWYSYELERMKKRSAFLLFFFFF